jgi:hypothetical protein
MDTAYILRATGADPEHPAHPCNLTWIAHEISTLLHRVKT